LEAGPSRRLARNQRATTSSLPPAALPAAAAEVADAEREAEDLRAGQRARPHVGFPQDPSPGDPGECDRRSALALAALQLVRNQMEIEPAQVVDLPPAMSADAETTSSQPAISPPLEEAVAPRPGAADTDVASALPQTEAPTPVASSPDAPEPTPAAHFAFSRVHSGHTARSRRGGSSMAVEPSSPPQTAALQPPNPRSTLGRQHRPRRPPAAAVPPAVPTSPPPAAATGSLPEPIGPDRLRESAQAGDAVAAFEVASRYAEGRGAAEDMPAAIAWYTRAAEAGLARREYRLGSIYEKGSERPRIWLPRRIGTAGRRRREKSRPCTT
jgi:localization factor PodJL